MEPEKRSLQACAEELLDLVLDSGGHDLVFREFRALEPKLKGATPEAFFREYVPFKLALGCVFWVGCCAEHRIEDRELTNLFFRKVMGLFESPNSVEEAKLFSESLYASNADPEQSPVLSVLVHLFHKLELKAIVGPDRNGSGELNAGFRFMMEVSEGLKTAFSNRFDELVHSGQALYSKNRKRL